MTISTFLSIASFSTILFSALYTLWDQLKNTAAQTLPAGYVHDHAKSADFLWEAEQAIPYATYLGSTMSEQKFDNPFSEEAEAHYRNEWKEKYGGDDEAYLNCMSLCEQGEFYADAVEMAMIAYNKRADDYDSELAEGLPGQDDAEGPNPWAYDVDRVAADIPEGVYDTPMLYNTTIVIQDEAYYLQDNEGAEYGPFIQLEPVETVQGLIELNRIDIPAYRIYVIACLNGCTHDEAIKYAVQEFKCRRNIVEVINPKNKSINI